MYPAHASPAPRPALPLPPLPPRSSMPSRSSPAGSASASSSTCTSSSTTRNYPSLPRRSAMPQLPPPRPLRLSPPSPARSLFPSARTLPPPSALLRPRGTAHDAPTLPPPPPPAVNARAHASPFFVPFPQAAGPQTSLPCTPPVAPVPLTRKRHASNHSDGSSLASSLPDEIPTPADERDDAVSGPPPAKRRRASPAEQERARCSSVKTSPSVNSDQPYESVLGKKPPHSVRPVPLHPANRRTCWNTETDVILVESYMESQYSNSHEMSRHTSSMWRKIVRTIFGNSLAPADEREASDSARHRLKKLKGYAAQIRQLLHTKDKLFIWEHAYSCLRVNVAAGHNVETTWAKIRNPQVRNRLMSTQYPWFPRLAVTSSDLPPTFFTTTLGREYFGPEPCFPAPAEPEAPSPPSGHAAPRQWHSPTPPPRSHIYESAAHGPVREPVPVPYMAVPQWAPGPQSTQLLPPRMTRGEAWQRYVLMPPPVPRWNTSVQPPSQYGNPQFQHTDPYRPAWASK